jgi:hypothetical protein
MEKCRHCGSERIIKTGHRDGQQKWRCKDCGKFQGEVDRREKCTEKERQTAIDLYLEGCGFRRIARILSGIFNRHVCSDWRLSPAYDLTPSIPISIERRDLALECGKYGRFANRYNLLSEASRFLLMNEEAEKIIDNMYFTVKNSWYSVARSAGVKEMDCEKIKSAFAYEGFNYEL